MPPRKPPKSEYPLVEPHDRAEWRAWLERNHATSPGIWLALGKKGNKVSDLGYEDAILEAVAFGWIDGQASTLDEDRFRGIFTPRKPGSGWAASNKARVERLLAEGLMTPAGLAAVEAAKADGSWNLLDDVEALVVPEDLATALEDAGVRQAFDGLSPGARKLALYWIATAKRPDTRAKRVAETVRAAREGRGPR